MDCICFYTSDDDIYVQTKTNTKYSAFYFIFWQDTVVINLTIQSIMNTFLEVIRDKQ